MSAEAVVKYELKGKAAWITLNSPEKRNALSADVMVLLNKHLHTAMDDKAVRVVVLTGAGTAFCAGADLKSAGKGATKDIEGDGDVDSPMVEALKLMWSGPKPVVGAINGHAFGGGLGLVAASDTCIAVEEAKFSFSEVRIGVIPAMISVVVLPKIGIHNGMRLFLTGERFDAEAARGYGLVHKVVTAEELESAVQDEIDTISQGGPTALMEAKSLVRDVPKMELEEAFAYTEKKSAELFASPEAAEGMAAFVGKRKPSWTE